MNVEQIVGMAEDFEFSTNRPLKSWLRAGQMLLTEAAICERDGDLQMAYLYLYRHAMLILSKLPSHHDLDDPRFKADISAAQKTVARNLSKLEQWKPRINRDYDRYVAAMERRNAERQSTRDSRGRRDDRRGSYDDSRRGSLDSEYGGYEDSARTLNAGENRQLAVDLAHQELRRRDATRQSSRQAGISPDTIAARRRGIVVDYDGDVEPVGSAADQRGDGVRDAGRYLHSLPSQRSSQADDRRTSKSTYKYPTVPAREESMDWPLPATGLKSPTTSIPPARPNKESLDRSSRTTDTAPPRPPPKSRDSLPPPTPQSPHSKYTFKPTAFTESGTPLRPVFLPPDLRKAFLNHAHPNTSRNLETCGILCGTLISNALFISHLIIPDQTSTSDTCDTTEEGDNALFDYCDANELLVCGWIHTHPTQTCFLSSPDLHTSSGYQIMLPEAIAIVCAPRHTPDWGVFRLTDPPGLSHVLNCQQRSLFHPHSETNLYTDAVKPGHVVEGPGLKFELADLRKS